MQRSTCWVIGTPLIRQVHSLPLNPYQTRSASAERSTRIRHLRIELVSFMLASPRQAAVITRCLGLRRQPGTILGRRGAGSAGVLSAT